MSIIKTFEQFVAEHYNKPVGTPINEAFQSRKLREIIKQHGKPKYSFANEMLYDIKDNEIVDVVTCDEYVKKYSDGIEKPDSKNREATFRIELEDGYCIVISNLGILKDFYDLYNRDAEYKKREIFKKRHAERHVGNLGKGGDNIHRKHLDNVNKILKKRIIEKLQENIHEIVEKVESEWHDIVAQLDLSEEDGESSDEFHTRFGNDEYILYIDYTIKSSDTWEDRGELYCNIYYDLISFEIYNEDDNISITNEELGITEKTHKELFKGKQEENVECGISDFHKAFGVNPGDFY